VATTRLNDALLVSRAALAGDREAFGRLVERYQSPVRRLFLHLTGDEELSKDLAQECFVKAWLGVGSFRAAANFSTWLYRIAFNTFHDNNRSRRPTAAEQDAFDTPATPREIDSALDLGRAVLMLKGRERQAVLLYYVEDMAVGQIARIMRVPSGTVKSHLARARAKLSKYLTGYEKQ
jgi:RNA polymerase sigma-70 factor (ECF subfamily)